MDLKKHLMHHFFYEHERQLGGFFIYNFFKYREQTNPDQDPANIRVGSFDLDQWETGNHKVYHSNCSNTPKPIRTL